MRTLIFLFSTLFCALSLYAQEDINQYQPATFQPPENAMIREFENGLAPRIEAKSLNGHDVVIPNLEKVQILWFWDEHIEDDNLLKLMMDLNAIADNELIVFLNSTSQDISKESIIKTSSLITVPNSRMISEAVFGHELGYPRVFLLGTSGQIEKVLTHDMISNLDQPFDYISSLCSSIK